jgi:hypothetical protein
MEGAEEMKLIEQIGYLDQARSLGPVPIHYTGKYHNHSTGREYRVFAHLGEESLEVFRVWEWYSSRYEFNDRDKVFGWQVPKEGHPRLAAWLAEIPSRYETVVREIAEKTKANNELVMERARTKVERFAAAFSAQEVQP